MNVEGLDVWSETGMADGRSETYRVDPTAPVSETGLPIIQRNWISGLAPSKVSERFYNWVLSAAEIGGTDWDLTRLRLHAMPQQWRLIYTVCWLQAEVDNGGFDQFFHNGNGDFDDATESDLLHIGAKAIHGLFIDARSIYYSAPRDREEEIAELENLTEEFYAQRKTPYHMVGDHIITNQNLYCCDVEPPDSQS